MILNAYTPKFQISIPSPEHSPRSSLILSDCEADDECAMSSEEHLSSRPLSLTIGGLHPILSTSRVPTLQEILSNSAPPPWTLSAFTSHLSQNHCLENLEFVKDAERYKREYNLFRTEFSDVSRSPHFQKRDEVKKLWQKILKAYITPNAPREVNLPGDVRDALLQSPNQTSPPPPEALDPAVKRIYELMNESVLMTFINELSPTRASASVHEDYDEREERIRPKLSPTGTRHRSRSRRKTSPLEVTSNQFTESLRHFSTNSRITGSHAPSPELMLTDDTGSLPSPTDSPMTPPTTPPSSDLGGSSPRMKSDNTWKKMIGKLGNKKKSSSKFDSGSYQ
jgi:hypothetical protein